MTARDCPAPDCFGAPPRAMTEGEARFAMTAFAKPVIGGGGVYVENGGTFSKTGGIIYGDDGKDLKNTASDITTSNGHAAYVNSNPTAMYRDTTAGRAST